MKAKELATKILAMIEAGELDPDAIVVRPFCLCDEDNGWIEARDDTEGVTFKVLLPFVKHDEISAKHSTEKTLEPVMAGVGNEENIQ